MQRAAISFIDSRKKFPERVTKVRPTPMMPTRAASRMIVFALNRVKKLGVVRAPDKRTTSKNAMRAIVAGEPGSTRCPKVGP